MMLRTLPAVALLGLGLSFSAAPPWLGPYEPPPLLGETCRGQAATLIGTSDADVEGTDGPDVVVTNGASWIDTGGGNDTVCVTGTEAYPRIEVGEGDDVVDASGASDPSLVTVTLGVGADTFVGSAGWDSVKTGSQRLRTYIGRGDLARDVVSTGAGDDYVQSGMSETFEGDVVDLGSGDDHAEGSGFGSVVGGEGDDWLSVYRPESTDDTGRVAIDAESGTVSIDDSVVSTWSSVESTSFAGLGGESQTYRGSSGDDYVDLSVATDVRGRGGDDEIWVGWSDGATVTGGEGHDLIRFDVPFSHVGQRTAYSTVRVNLASHRLVAAVAGRRVAARLSGFEAVDAAASQLVIGGSRNADEINVATLGCSAAVRGRGGPDEISVHGVPISDCANRRPIRLLGGPGADVLTGSWRKEVLIGGPGNDIADGKDSSDRCVAERERNCEL